jgi:hypothetical protein
MAVLRPRNRIVYFRVSEQEFESFRDMCQCVGARSISDLARSAMRNLARQDETASARVSDQLMSLETMLQDLNRKIHLLTESLGRPNLELSAGKEPIVTGQTNA